MFVVLFGKYMCTDDVGVFLRIRRIFRNVPLHASIRSFESRSVIPEIHVEIIPDKRRERVGRAAG